MEEEHSEKSNKLKSVLKVILLDILSLPIHYPATECTASVLSILEIAENIAGEV